MGTYKYQELDRKRAGIEGYSLGTPQEVQDRLSAGKETGTGKSVLRVQYISNKL